MFKHVRALRHAVTLFLIAFALSAARPAAAATPTGAAPGAVLDAASFEGPGRTGETLLHVQALGRYAVISEGTQGARIELVDRMAGTMASAGRDSGVEAASGRIDAFLEPGDYKVRVSKPTTGRVALSVRTYATVNAGTDPWDVPVLADRQTVTGELHDLELQSWWVRVDASDPTLVVEMEGRSLSDAAVWKDGVWDTGLRPSSRTFEPEPGKPITTLEFSAKLDPGVYLLVCVGGPGKQWAGEATRDTFAVSRGARFLGRAGIVSVTFGERGFETFLVGSAADYFQVRAQNNKGYVLAVAPNSAGSSRFAYRRVAAIDAKSTSYRASSYGTSGGTTQWLTLQGPPGETVEVRWFPSLPSVDDSLYPVDPGQQSDPYCMAVLGGADGEESIDLTGLEISATESGDTFSTSLSGEQPVRLGAARPVHRRINLLSRLSFLLHVETAGGYDVAEATGSAAGRYSFLLLDDWITGESEVEPVTVAAGGTVQLQAKLYIVSLEPTRGTDGRSGAGILEFAFAAAGTLRPLDAAPISPPVNALFWPRVDPASDGSRRSLLVLGNRYGIPMGGFTRALPLDLAEPVLLEVEAGSTLELAFENEAPVRLFSTNPAFSGRTARVDGVPWAADRDVAAGTHVLALSNATAGGQWHVVGAVSAAPAGAFDPPRPGFLEDVLPTFTEGSPLWRDFGRSELASLLLVVTEPASYRISTSGRLAMSITIRTLLKPSLFSASQNADGRGAVVTSYLRPGTYLVQARTQGSSQGRAGLLVQHAAVTEAGALAPGSVRRSTVPAGALLGADVRIDAEEDYRLECLGLGRSFAWRFEDSGGWPIGQPVASGTLTTRLTPGTYRYISAADEVQTRRLASLQLAPSAARTAYDLQGKQLPVELNRTYAKTWVEAAGRPEDVFTFSIPARLRLRLSVSKGMRYRVLDAAGAAVLAGQGGVVGDMDLAAGSYRVAVQSAEEDNLKEYRILVETDELCDGGTRALASPPQRIPVSVGKPGTIELWSYGTQEVEAWLLDPAGAIVARSATIPDDWNFRLVTSLAPGRYTLLLLPPGSAAPAESPAPSATASGAAPRAGSSFDSVPSRSLPAAGASVVRLASRPEIRLGTASGSLEASREIAGEVAVTAFTAKAAGVFRFDAQADVPVSASVSRSGRVLAAGACPVFLPMAPAVAYEVRFWQSSGEPRTLLFRVAQERSTDVTLAAAPSTVDVPGPVLKVIAPLAAGFAIEPETADRLWYSPGTDAAFGPVAGEALGTLSGAGWVVRADGAAVGRVSISPLVLAGGTARAIRVGPVRQSFGVTVPPRTVAVLRTDNAGRPVGISASTAAAFRSDRYDWHAASVTPLASALGLRAGSFRGLLWDAEASTASAAERRATVSAAFYPQGAEKPLAMGQRIEQAVPPRSSVSFGLSASAQSVRVSLQRGLSAFAWVEGSPSGFLDARVKDLTGYLEVRGGAIVVVNESGAAGICVVEASVSRAISAITDAAGYEGVLAEPRALSFPVSADTTSRIHLWGSGVAARLLREDDGRIYAGELSATEYGPVLSFPAGKGILEVSAAGALRIWVAKPAAARAGFVARSTPARTAALGAAGSTLGQGPETWTYAVASDAIVALGAEGGGITALYDTTGALVAAAAGERGRTLLASLRAGSYSAFTRPLKGGVPPGTIRLQVLAAQALGADGEGETVLVGPKEKRLYRFQVKVASRVGAGIRAGSESLTATLFDQGFRPIDSGRIFIRSLSAGTYFLLVESGDSTVSFAPVVYGLEGNRAGTPDEVMKSYTRE